MTEDDSVKNETGFDLFYFINLFRSQFEVGNANIFTVNEERDLSRNRSLRIVLSGGYTNTRVKQDTLPDLQTVYVGGDLKVGYAWKTKFFHRWQLYGGVDWDFQYGYNKLQQLVELNDGVTDDITRNWQSGPGPFAGLKFLINPRISLSTESDLNMVYLYTNTRTIHALHPELNTNYLYRGVTTVFTVPHNIYLNIKF